MKFSPISLKTLKKSGLFHLKSRVIPIMMILFLGSCRKNSIDPCVCSPLKPFQELPIRSADLSSWAQVQANSNTFYDRNGMEDSQLGILINHGLNTVRLRLWHNPSQPYSSFKSIKEQSDLFKGMGLKVWLSVHYSDSWADPGQQVIPVTWQGISFDNLKDSVSNYTQKIMEEINPEYFQIGNEINTGFLHPIGHLSQNENQFLEILEIASQSVRNKNSETQIILHFAGIQNSSWFFDKVKDIDFDFIGLSYYPWWHGNNLSELDRTISHLGSSFGKDIILAETAYPFTLDWNDFTNNIVGDSSQLILPTYPASRDGQYQFMNNLKNLLYMNRYAKGISYWGGEWIAFDGPQSNTGSPWENCALFDFNNKAVPAIQFLN